MVTPLVYFSWIKLHEQEFWSSTNYWRRSEPVLCHDTWGYIAQNNKLDFENLRGVFWNIKVLS
jgi:hypothetical protein